MNQETIAFLQKLSKNNNRPWFQSHKAQFDIIYSNFKELAERVKTELEKSDHIESVNVFRIYRDIRFSTDKTPYKTNLSAGYKRATKRLRGGYYFEVDSDGSAFVGGGFWSPSPEDVKRIRDEFAADSKTILKITSQKSFKAYFGELQGEGLKNAPRGYDSGLPLIELIKKKQFVIRRLFSKEEVLHKGFEKEIVKTFIAMRPFFDYMSSVLTTDINGEEII